MHLYSKTKKGIEYFYLRQTKRVEGKVVCEFQKYIGNKEKLMEVIQNGCGLPKLPNSPKTSDVRYFGAVAALWNIAEKIELKRIVDKNILKRQQGMSIGSYLLVAAINRSICPKSKNSIADWVEKTSLPNLMEDLEIHQLNSQSFWNQMDSISEESVHSAENELAKKIVNTFKLKLDTLLYDSTNYYSYIHTFNPKNTLEQRGKNKQHRTDLRQANLALLVTKDHHIPLYHKVYNGNENDYTSFGDVIDSLNEKVSLLSKDKKNTTLVFDAGNVSTQNMRTISDHNLSFVSKLKLSDHKDLLKVPLEKYETLLDPEYEGIKIYTTKKEVYASEKTLVIKYSKEHFCAESTTLERQITNAKTDLEDLSIRLQKYIDDKKLPNNVTCRSVENAVSKIFGGKCHLKFFISCEVNNQDNYPLLSWTIDESKRNSYIEMYLGKTIYFTNREDLTAKQVLEIYSFQYQIEHLFKISKNRRSGCWWPKYHWTDQKIKIHAFYCYLSLLLTSILQMEASKIDIKNEPHNLIESLNDIVEIIDRHENAEGQLLEVRRHNSLNASQSKLFNLFKFKKYFQK